jgi:hypothetical protein
LIVYDQQRGKIIVINCAQCNRILCQWWGKSFAYKCQRENWCHCSGRQIQDREVFLAQPNHTQ